LERAATFFMELLTARLPAWTFVPPAGGLSLWVHTGIDGDELARRALLHGVTVAPGSTASRGPVGRVHLRLCFDRPALELDAATSRLRCAHDDCASSGS
jgi:DNA-binding transcriptional MocR family regulator